MIHARDGCERDDVVAVLADVRRRHVGQRLADRIDSVVTGHATARDIVVIEVRGHEGGRRVAIRARIAARDMVRALTRGRRAVVATRASTENVEVIDLRDRCECDHRMAILADVRR